MRVLTLFTKVFVFRGINVGACNVVRARPYRGTSRMKATQNDLYEYQSKRVEILIETNIINYRY